MAELKPGAVVAGAVLGIAGIAGVQYYTISNLRAVETKLNQVQADQAKAKEALTSELDKVQAQKAAAETERQQGLAALRAELENAKKVVTVQPASSPAGQEALRTVKELSTRIASTEQQLRDGQSKIIGEVTGLKQTATENATTIAAVTTEVREVRDQVASARGQLESTISDLKRVNGDMGVLSGLIATNGKEIEALRQFGDRNYAEFTIRKGNQVRLGDVWVSLKALNEGKNRYTVEVRVDDRKLEKKDKALNEPVQFYVGQSRQPHELVVNQIQKGVIIGYLATPKVSTSRQ